MRPVAKKCLFVVSGEGEVESANHQGSVSAYSFIQAHGLLTRAHIEVCIASPGARAPKFFCENEEESQWVDQHSSLLSSIRDLNSLSASDWDALFVPSGLGCLLDLSNSDRLGALVSALASQRRPVCVAGHGAAALGKARGKTQQQSSTWCFEGYNVTGHSNMELARLPYFAKLPQLPEDFIVENGALYSCSTPDSVYVCIDRNLISAQNSISTTLAVLNLIWLLNSGD